MKLVLMSVMFFSPFNVISDSIVVYDNSFRLGAGDRCVVGGIA